MEREERARPILHVEMSQDIEVRDKGENRTGFITRKDETGRASGWASPGNLGGYAGNWWLIGCGRGQVKDHTGFLVQHQIDGGANKRQAKKSLGDKYSRRQVEFPRPLGHPGGAAQKTARPRKRSAREMEQKATVSSLVKGK